MLSRYVFLTLESERSISLTFNQVWYCKERFVLALGKDNNTNENGFSANAIQNLLSLLKGMIIHFIEVNDQLCFLHPNYVTIILLAKIIALFDK